MAASIAGITGAVASAVAQEVMGRAVSFMLGKREDTPPPPPHTCQHQQGHEAERLRMALAQLASALERTGKVPITDVSLLDHRKTFKLAYAEGAALLDRHLQQEEDEGEETSQVPKRRRWLTAARRLLTASPASSSGGGLSACAVRRFEWLADCAGKFVRDVESGCSLRHFTFCSPLVRHLLAGRHLRYEARQGAALRCLDLWPICLEGRGVETVLEYHYRSAGAPDAGFLIQCVVRLSESMDLFGTAVACLRAMASQLRLASDTAAAELTLLAGLQDVCDSSAPPWLYVDQGKYTRTTHAFRRDPVCCKGNAGGCGAGAGSSPSELSQIFPEQVIAFTFWCCIPALDCGLSDSDEGEEGGRSVARHLKMTAFFLPHACHAALEGEEEEEQGSWALDLVGDNPVLGDISIQQAAEMVRTKAPKCFSRQPELTTYAVGWGSSHGSAMFLVEKPCAEAAGAPKTGCK